MRAGISDGPAGRLIQIVHDVASEIIARDWRFEERVKGNCERHGAGVHRVSNRTRNKVNIPRSKIIAFAGDAVAAQSRFS